MSAINQSVSGNNMAAGTSSGILTISATTSATIGVGFGYTNALIQDVSLYDRVLSPAEIMALYDAEK